MVKIKVCGITNFEDAEKALEFGADLLGFNFFPPSSRCVKPDTAARIIAKLSVPSRNVALFVNESKARVREVTGCGSTSEVPKAYSCLQFHGEESAEYCRSWDLQVIKAFRLKGKESLRGIEAFPADFILLDSWSAGYGGSGAAFPWEWLKDLDTEKIILSGGLTVDNVARAVRSVRPYAIDVCSGVEARPGVKDHAKLKEFIIAAKGA